MSTILSLPAVWFLGSILLTETVTRVLSYQTYSNLRRPISLLTGGLLLVMMGAAAWACLHYIR